MIDCFLYAPVVVGSRIPRKVVEKVANSLAIGSVRVKWLLNLGHRTEQASVSDVLLFLLTTPTMDMVKAEAILIAEKMVEGEPPPKGVDIEAWYYLWQARRYVFKKQVKEGNCYPAS